MHSWNTFGAQTRHEQKRIHKIHHNPDLGETTTFSLIVFFVLGHGSSIQMSFCFGTPKLGVLKFPKLGLLRFWRPMIFFVDLRLSSVLQSCILRQEFSNSMWHATCT
jgi:hypothetical protein